MTQPAVISDKLILNQSVLFFNWILILKSTSNHPVITLCLMQSKHGLLRPFTLTRVWDNPDKLFNSNFLERFKWRVIVLLWILTPLN